MYNTALRRKPLDRWVIEPITVHNRKTPIRVRKDTIARKENPHQGSGNQDGLPGSGRNVMAARMTRGASLKMAQREKNP